MIRRAGAFLAVTALAAATLAAVAAPSAPAQTGPVGYTVGAQTLGEDNGSFYAVDMPTGAATQLNTDPVTCADGLTFSPDGTLYAYRQGPEAGISTAELVTINVADGTQTLVGALPNVAIGAGGMTFDVDGSLWLYGLSNDPACSADVATCLWSVNPTDASATFVGTSGDVAEFVLGLAATCDPGVVAITGPAASGPPAGSSLELVDTATAALSEIVPVSDIAFPEGLDYAADGTLWAIALGQIAGFASAQTSLIYPATGATTNAPITVGGDAFSGFLLGLAIDPPAPCPTPEPEPVVLQPTFTG
jgi:hypothetical protein